MCYGAWLHLISGSMRLCFAVCRTLEQSERGICIAKKGMDMAAETTEALIVILAGIPDRVEELARRAGTDKGASAAGNEEWTPSEIAGHLCDSARYWGRRMRRVAYEERPALEIFDENASVRLAAYRYKTLAPLLGELRLLSADTVAFLRALPSDAWERVGVHPERGPLTLHAIAEIEAEHEQMHVGQFARALGLE